MNGVTFRVSVNQFSKLKGPVLSRPSYFRNLAWQIQVQSQLSDLRLLSTKSLGVYLRCNDESKSNSWCCYVVAELRLISVRPDVKPRTKKLQHIFYSKENISGFSSFLPWNYVSDIRNGYIEDDSITVEVHLLIGRGIVEQLLDLEAKLEEEKRENSFAILARYRFEGDLKKAQAQVKLQEKKIEDTLEQLNSEQSKKKTPYTEKAKDTQNELGPSSKGEERIGKVLEAELVLLTVDLSCSEQARRAAEAERDELQYENTNCNSKAILLEDEKRRLEAKIATLEEELVEEQSSNERQNIELKAKFSAFKITHRTEVYNLEEQLEAEAKERLAHQTQSRNLDKKLKELEVQLEDERRHAHQYKDQIEKMNGRVKAVKRQLEETEEKMSRERGQKRKFQLKLVEWHESITQEISNLESKDLSSSHSGTSTCSSLQSEENGSGYNYKIKEEILDS